MRRLALAALLLLPLGCASPTPDAAPAPQGGTGGAGGDDGACADLGAASPCHFQGFGDGCADGEVCTVAQHPSCGAESCCTLAVSCEPRTGAVPPGFRCEEDADCASALCVSVGGVGSCLRACDGTAAGCPGGQLCALLALDEVRSVRHCVGTGEGGAFDGARTLCAGDRDCPDDRHCAVLEGDGLYLGKAHGSCEAGPRPAGAGRACEAGQEVEIPADGSDRYRGAIWSGLCGETGLCHSACNEIDAEGCNCVPLADEPFCRGWRCTLPCTTDAQCPSRFICGLLHTEEQHGVDPDLNFKICQFPSYVGSDWGCFDETDCCSGGVQRRGTVCCDLNSRGLCDGPPSDLTHCRVELQGARFLSRCTEPEGRAELGAPCALHADCESGLCGPAGQCTSPCDPGPDGDRCAELLPGTSCCPMLAGEACVPACLADCAAAPACP